MQKTMVKMVLELGFSQVCQSKEVRVYMERARKLCKRHFHILGSILEEENLHIPRIFETEVTDLTVSPFSDKLMLFHITTLLSAALGYYSEALSMSQRRDLSADYTRKYRNCPNCRRWNESFNRKGLDGTTSLCCRPRKLGKGLEECRCKRKVILVHRFS